MPNVCNISALTRFKSNRKHVPINSSKFRENALVNEIDKETFELFAQQGKMTIKEFSVDIIDRTTE